MRRWIRRIAFYVLSFLFISVSAGAFYQWYGAEQDKRQYWPMGTLYKVAGHNMHLYAGGQGDTTVIFASGWGTASPYADFSPLYAGLEPHVKVAVYDRFGYGFSETTGRKRDIDTITDEMHELLRVSGQKPPYIMVGHSLGSLEAIRYAQRFPDEVKGILLIDGGSPEYYASHKGYAMLPLTYRMLRTTGVIRALYNVKGFAEWVNDQSNGHRLLPSELKEMDRKAVLLKIGNRDMTNEMRQSQSNAEAVLAGAKPLPIPLTVLTADYEGRLSDDQDWMNSQAALPSWSVEGKQIIVPNSSHYIHGYQPDAVVRELLALAAAGKAPVQ